MAESDKPRPVSGEIMTGPAKTHLDRAQSVDVVEAEFESVTSVTPSVPAARPVGGAGPALPVRGMDMLRGMGGRVERAARGGPVFWGLGLVIVACAFWVSGGHALLGRDVDTRRVASGQPLAIENVTSRVEERGGRHILFIEGETRNRGAGTLPVPPLAIAITDGGGTTTRHFLGTNGTHLAPDERFGFSSRVEAPSNGVKSVTVTFREE